MQFDPIYLNAVVLAVLAWAIRALYSHVTEAVKEHEKAVATLTTRLALIENDLNHMRVPHRPANLRTRQGE